MKEFNNRKKADKFAEYITGKALRKYIAEKVKKYAGENITIFDGACGSGQLEEFIQPKFLYGVEIQEEAAAMARENFPQSEIQTMSFFNFFTHDRKADCTVMNPPFSMKFKELTAEEQKNIQTLYPWKKSGVVDDIFLLKGLLYTKRFGIFLSFPGVTYRKTEKKFRDSVGRYLVELSEVRHGFENTDIPVVLLVFDLCRAEGSVHKEIFDCKVEKVLYEEEVAEENERFSIPKIPMVKEEVDPVALEVNARKYFLQHMERSLATSQFLCTLDEQLPPFQDYVKSCQSVLDGFREG